MESSPSERVDHGAVAQAEPLIRLEKVDKTFQMGEVAVRAAQDVSLEVYRGEFLAMVGPSGSGKSTILNIIGGLDIVTAGKAWVGQEALSDFSPRQLTKYRRDTVGFVFQFYNLVPTLSARENVMVSTEISADPMNAMEALDLVGLKDRADHFPSQLSGGEQQRVAIARALAKNPDLVLCDEPTGALDFATGKKVLRLLVDLKNRLGKTIIMITHNSALAQAADRVIRLRSGQVVEVTANTPPVPPEDIVW